MRNLIALLLLGTIAVWGQDTRLPSGTYSQDKKTEHASYYDVVKIQSDHSMTWTHGESSMDSNSQSAVGTWSLHAMKNGSWIGTFHIQTLNWGGYRPSGTPEHPAETSLFGQQLHPGDTCDFMLVAEPPDHFQFTAFDHAQTPTFTADLVKVSH